MTGTLYTEFPYHFGSDGLTARTSRADHARELLEQLLMTRQGERLTRPALGCGLPDLLFAPLRPEQASAVRTTIDVAVQEHLSREIALTALEVRIDGSALLIDLRYRIVPTGEVSDTSLRLEAAP